MGLRAFSYGGGIQSTACLVLAAERRIDFESFLFANVGDDSEHPSTLSYVDTIAAPYAAAHGLDLVILRRRRRDGSPAPTLLEALAKPTSRSIEIPVRFGPGAAPGNRTCTGVWKIKVVSRWLREHGATATDPADIGIGFSVDELGRAKPSREPLQRSVFPLLDLRLTRADCGDIIRAAGLPLPRKSACWFCPYTGPGDWRRMKADEPDLFDRAVALERSLHDRAETIGRTDVYLSAFGKPLDEVGLLDAPTLDFDGGECDSFSCMT